MGWTVYNSSGQILQGSSTLADESVDSDHYVDASIDNIHLAAGIDAVKLADGSVTNAELQYINSLSSNAQVQIAAVVASAAANAATAASKAAVGSGTPSTQTLPDTAATGTSTEAARLDHVHAMPAGGGAVTREGGVTSESNTATTSVSDLITASNLSITGTQSARFLSMVRQTSGATAMLWVGFKLNGSAIWTPVANGTHIWRGTNNNQVSEGGTEMTIGPRGSDYTGFILGHGAAFHTNGTQAGSGSGMKVQDHDGALPTGTITSLALQGILTTSGITGFVDQLHVYSYAV